MTRKSYIRKKDRKVFELCLARKEKRSAVLRMPAKYLVDEEKGRIYYVANAHFDIAGEFEEAKGDEPKVRVCGETYAFATDAEADDFLSHEQRFGDNDARRIE